MCYEHFVCKTHCLPTMVHFALGKPWYGRQKTKAPHFKHCSISCTPVCSNFPSSLVDGGAYSRSLNSSGGLHALRLRMQSRNCFPNCLSAFLKKCFAEMAIKQESIKKIQKLFQIIFYFISNRKMKLKMYRKAWELVKTSWFFPLLNVLMSLDGI